MNQTTHTDTTCTGCADCGATFIPSDCTPGYAVLRDGRRICYACADKRERDELRDRSRPFCAYLSGDGARITTWTGGTLMTVTQSRPCRLTRMSYTHDRNSFRSIRARDIHGGNWYGRGSAGICITLRPCN